MTVALEDAPLALPSTEHCVVWTAEASSLFKFGAVPWRRVLDPPIRAMQHFEQVADAPVFLFMAAHPWTDALQRPATLVSLYFATDAPVTRSQLAELGRPLPAETWSYDGIHALPEHGFPCAAVVDRRLHHLWVDDPDHGPLCVELVPRGARARKDPVPLAAAEPSRFVPGAAHALVAPPSADDAERQLREQLKLAFTYKVAERVIEADGRVVDDERAFVLRTFPAEELEARWLDDPAVRDPLAERAATELAHMLGYHEKLALLSTFFAACYADGQVAVQELRVLKEASEALGLDREEVVEYLRRMW